jgi:hypothetical protein
MAALWQLLLVQTILRAQNSSLMIMIIRKTKYATTFSECQKEQESPSRTCDCARSCPSWLPSWLCSCPARAPPRPAYWKGKARFAIVLALLGYLLGFALALLALLLGQPVGRGRHDSPDGREFSVSGRHKSHGEGGGEEDGSGGGLHYFLRSI